MFFSTTQVFCSSSLIAGLKAKRDNLTMRKDPHRLEAFYRATFTLPEKSGTRKREAPGAQQTSLLRISWNCGSREGWQTQQIQMWAAPARHCCKHRDT